MAAPLQAPSPRKRNRAVRIAIAAIACIPLIYGGALIWANQDPTHRLDRVPAAVVDLDRPVTQHGTTVDVGKTLTHELVSEHRDDSFDWTKTDAATARAGLKDGRYLAMITLPKDLSAHAVSLGGDKPLDAATSHITITSNDGRNYIVGVASKTIGLAISQSAAKSVSQQYLSRIYGGLNDISDQLGDAADGAQQLASGAGDLSSGTGTLADGASTAADGAATLSNGTSRLAAGAQTLASGAGQLASGAQSLSGGLSQLDAQSAALPGAASQLAAGARQLQSGIAGDGTAADPGYAGGVDRLADSCASGQVKLAATVDPVVAQLCGGIDQVAGTQPDGSHANSDRLRAGAEALASGTAQLSAQAPALVGGIDQAADGAGTLAAKTAEAADGAKQLASAAQQAAAGASSLSTGTAQLAAGAQSVDSGARQLDSSSSRLADKLASGQASAPRYDSREQKHLSSVAAQPISLAQSRMNGVPSYGYGLAPYFMALGAWVGGLSIYMLLRAIPHSALAARRPAWLAALLGYLRGAAISLAQTALLYLIVTLGIGVRPEHPVALALFLGLTGAAFTAVNHALMVVFGSRGRFLGLILLVLQVAAAGATYPIQTTPGFFQVVHGLLPMTYAANGIRSLIAGGSAGIGAGVLVLACWLAAALAISIGVSVFRRSRQAEILLPDFAI